MMTDKAGSGDSKVRKDLRNPGISEQRPEQKEEAWGSNIPEAKTGSRSSGKMFSVSPRDSKETRVASAQARGRGAEI